MLAIEVIQDIFLKGLKGLISKETVVPYQWGSKT